MLLGFLLFIYPQLNPDYFDQLTFQQQRVVHDLELTDLCLFTEARYNRHLSLADLHSPFQDNPMAFDTFPSGSITMPTILTLGSVQ